MNLAKRPLARVAILCGLFAVTPPASAIDGTPTWFGQTVANASANSFISSPSLAFDHYGSPGIAWSSVSLVGGTNAVNRSQLLGLGIWQHQTHASGVELGVRTALAFDRHERPVVAWANANGAVQASFNNGAPQTVAASGAASSFSAMSLSYDLAGNLRGMYRGNTMGEFYGINHNGASFSNSLLSQVSGPLSIFDGDLTTDGAGRRHLAMRTQLPTSQHAIYLASEPTGGGAWPSAQFLVADEVLGIDLSWNAADGKLALAFTTRSSAGVSKLFYSKHNGFAFETTEVLSSSLFSFEDLSLEFDLADGRPAIALERRTNSSGAQELHLAYLGGAGQWSTSLIDADVQFDAPPGHVRKPSLAFDDYGTTYPAVAYVDADGSLAVAFDPPVPEPASLALLTFGMLACRARRRRPYTMPQS